MNQKLRSKIILVLIGFAVLYTINVAGAAWSDPNSGAPAGNISNPVTTLSKSQVKNGSLSVGTFIAAGDASFGQQTFFRGKLIGQNSSGVAAPLKIGGTDTSNVVRDVDVAATGKVSAVGTLGAQELITPPSTKRYLCADSVGHIVFCPLPQYAPSTLAFIGGGPTSGPVQGGTQDTNVWCGATISTPAPTGGVNISFQYHTNLDGFASQSCTVYIPAGATFAEDYPGREYFGGSSTNVSVTDYCYDAGSSATSSGTPIPNDPGSGISTC